MKTNETNRLIYLKVKRDEWSKEGESGFSFISMKTQQRSNFLCSPDNQKSHTCLVKTNETNRLIYLKVKRDEWSKEGESGFSFISMKTQQRSNFLCSPDKTFEFSDDINFTSFLCGSPPSFRPLSHFFLARSNRVEFRIHISGINVTAMHAAQLLSYGSMKMINYLTSYSSH